MGKCIAAEKRMEPRKQENYGMFVLKWHFHSLSPKSPAGGLEGGGTDGVQDRKHHHVGNGATVRVDRMR